MKSVHQVINNKRALLSYDRIFSSLCLLLSSWLPGKDNQNRVLHSLSTTAFQETVSILYLPHERWTTVHFNIISHWAFDDSWSILLKLHRQWCSVVGWPSPEGNWTRPLTSTRWIQRRGAHGPRTICKRLQLNRRFGIYVDFEEPNP